MGRKLDDELQNYKQQIGKEKFDHLYKKYYAMAKYNKRFSGKHYNNSPEKLAAIKEKYKNGISKSIIEEMLK